MDWQISSASARLDEPENILSFVSVMTCYLAEKGASAKVILFFSHRY
jgi:hypothetical protein